MGFELSQNLQRLQSHLRVVYRGESVGRGIFHDPDTLVDHWFFPLGQSSGYDNKLFGEHRGKLEYTIE